MAVVVKTGLVSFWLVGAPPILEPILVGIGMFTAGTIWLLTHGHISSLFRGFPTQCYFMTF